MITLISGILVAGALAKFLVDVQEQAQKQPIPVRVEEEKAKK